LRFLRKLGIGGAAVDEEGNVGLGEFLCGHGS
jgi:hypothetical protein